MEVNLGSAPGYALPDDLDVEPEPEPWGALLPGLDVTATGWFDRDWYLGGHRSRVFGSNATPGRLRGATTGSSADGIRAPTAGLSCHADAHLELVRIPELPHRALMVRR